jgi:hypothetical protein
MGCDYFESTILSYEYTFKDQHFSGTTSYSTRRGYIYPSNGESYEEALNKALEYKKEFETNNESHMYFVLNEIYSKHDFLYSNEKFISPFDSITEDELRNYVKVSNLLCGKYSDNEITVDQIKNKIQRENNILLAKLNQNSDIKIKKVICKVIRFER